MKTISEQLKDLGLKHGDLCEIEGSSERMSVYYAAGRALVARSSSGAHYDFEQIKVTCGWKATEPIAVYSSQAFSIYYTQVFPTPEVVPLPDAVEFALKLSHNARSVEDRRLADREVARAIIAECKKV